MSKHRPDPSIDLLPEYVHADLGDQRRSERLLKVAAATAAAPAASLRSGAADDAALEGTYRLLNNPAVEAEDIFGPHQRQTLRRSREHGSVIVIHDTTETAFAGHSEREGLGRLRKNGGMQGFYLHLSLVVTDDDVRTPLGVARFATHTREGAVAGKKPHRAYREDPYHEGRRWLEGARDSEQALAGVSECVHVMDREADSYELLTSLSNEGSRFVVRMCSDRATSTPVGQGKAHVSVRQTLADKDFVVRRDVILSRRNKSKAPKHKSHPLRESRTAELRVRATEVEVLRPTSASTDLPRVQLVHAVQVCEMNAPEGEQPVEWTLLTNLPIGSERDLTRIIDIYRARWVIEEYFKALKTGCALERRQNESFHALRNLMAILLPIAWRMLVLRTLAALGSTAPASTALTRVQLEVLTALSRKPLPENPTVTDAMWAIASLAGHHHRRTRLGWQTLGTGFERLLQAETVWIAARAEM